MFLAAAIGLLTPASIRRYAAVGLLALLLVVWPGNWYGAVEAGSYVSPGGPNVIDWIRVPFQLLFVAVVWWANRDVLTRDGIRWYVRRRGHPHAR
ncbi:hypothetical protein ACQP2F_15675 [Actinoplanes sp. CA-030573]|uniref:hypothetical protein n=1 Tax=Actinoplanes sp. CA-030573 TaxID=3239898 RepID=UPI003D8FADBC